jgi:hypothetical protein
VVDEYEMGSHAKLKKIQLQNLHSRGANKTSQKDKAKHVLATLTAALGTGCVKTRENRPLVN